MGDLYQLLACPRCGTSPAPGSDECPGCGRTVTAHNGGLDLLDDDLRSAADRFAAQYQMLRIREGWADSDGREDPEGGRRPWKGRLDSMSDVADIFEREASREARPVIGDVGSGGGWAAHRIRAADVLAFDLLDVRPNPAAALTIRADMRSLPVRGAALDGVVYAASLHYVPLAEALAEAARVLRPHGLLVAVDSPIYEDARAQAGAMERTARYYAKAGYPDLAAHYHPIDARHLKSALADSGFDVERLAYHRSTSSHWRRFLPRAPSSVVVARRSAATG